MTYTSLHNHSCYSNLKLIDGIIRPNELVDYAYELGLRGVALTDHDCISGHVQIWNYYNKKFTEEQRQNFKLILGNEIYLCRSDLNEETHQKGEKFYHLILLAKDDLGYEQLRKISTRAWERAYYKNILRTPTFSEDLFDIIEPQRGHLIATTACLGGYCGSMFAAGEFEKIDSHLQTMRYLFGDDFYIELQPSKQEDQVKYNNYMYSTYGNEYKFVVSTDSHYLKAEDRDIHKVFLNSKSSGDREVDSFYASAYMMGYEELVNYFVEYNGFPRSAVEQMCANTNEICGKIGSYNLKRTSVIPRIKYEEEAIDLLYGKLIGTYPDETTWIRKTIDKGESADIYLLNLVAKNWNKVPTERGKEYVIELDYECEQLYKISEQLNQSMSNYFITMAKMIDIMWEEANSIVGPGRGSAGSSLINYLLGITQIDPLDQPLEMPFWR